MKRTMIVLCLAPLAVLASKTQISSSEMGHGFQGTVPFSGGAVISQKPVKLYCSGYCQGLGPSIIGATYKVYKSERRNLRPQKYFGKSIVNPASETYYYKTKEDAINNIDGFLSVSGGQLGGLCEALGWNGGGTAYNGEHCHTTGKIIPN